jgi:antitoxin component of RelBE/YafQ-DinJ toxin-antitoxin module
MKNLHEIVKDLQFEEAENRDDESTFTFRVGEDIKLSAKKILKQNGVDVSSFLRRCLQELVADYRVK